MIYNGGRGGSEQTGLALAPLSHLPGQETSLLKEALVLAAPWRHGQRDGGDGLERDRERRARLDLGGQARGRQTRPQLHFLVIVQVLSTTFCRLKGMIYE